MGPVTIFESTDLFPYQVDDVRHALYVRITEIEHIEHVGATASKMCMGVEQPGCGRVLLEIDALGAGCGKSQNLVGGSHGQQSAVGDRHGLGDRVVGIDGDDLPVVENQIDLVTVAGASCRQTQDGGDCEKLGDVVVCHRNAN